MFKGFREFILRGNVIDLAIAVVIGTAFTAIVNTLVEALFNPIIGALFNSSSLTKLFIVEIPALDGSVALLKFGTVIGAVIQFLVVALVVYFAIVLPINRLSRLSFRKAKAADTATPTDVAPTETELLIQIRDLLAGRQSPEGDHTVPSPAPASGSHAAQ